VYDLAALRYAERRLFYTTIQGRLVES